ncbi:excalibur calcium-binding domain-containing protein [Sphingobium cloacae]|uniref:excalibur calcium-binding domain-containing protein n=2 Tax=Sphingobium cloacae TaxID=120107 RepID=UPI0009FE9485|nr:excalibur calcium-binding domain-containing protein [Sphingobium cloacae]
MDIRLLLGGAMVIGLAAGVGSVALSADGRQTMGMKANEAAVATGMARARPPEPGDSWGGCNDARAAGTSPIYRGEPGYRSDMDGDDDGIACEPYH